MAVVAPAWTSPSGQHHIIVPTQPPKGTGRSTRSDYRGLVTIGLGASAVAGLALVVYPLIVFGYTLHKVVGVLLTIAIVAGLAVGAMAFLVAMGARIVCRQADRRAADLHALRADIGQAVAADLDCIRQAVVAGQAALAELPEELRDRVDRQAAGYRAMLDQAAEQIATRVEAAQQTAVARLEKLERRVAAVEGDAAEFGQGVLAILRDIRAALPERLGERLGEVEQTVEEQAEMVAQATKAEAIISRVTGNGQVRQLYPPNPRGGR